MLLQNTQYSSLCYTVGPCWQSTLSTVVRIFNPKLLIYSSLPSLRPLWQPEVCQTKFFEVSPPFQPHTVTHQEDRDLVYC